MLKKWISMYEYHLNKLNKEQTDTLLALRLLSFSSLTATNYNISVTNKVRSLVVTINTRTNDYTIHDLPDKSQHLFTKASKLLVEVNGILKK